MLKRLVSFFLFLPSACCLLTALPAAGQPQPSASPPPTVRDIVFQGFSGLSDQQMRAVMETKAPEFFQLSQPPPFNPQALERDLERLEKLYQENGYFQARLSSQVTRQPQYNTVTVTLKAQPGPPTLVQEVVLRFASPAQAQQWEKPLRGEIPLKPGKRFQLSDYEKAKSDIQLKLANHGYPLNELRGQVRVFRRRRRAQVLLEVDTGPRLLFGPCRVTNNQKVQASYILREKTFARGELFSSEALQATERALLNTGFFSSVGLTPEYEQRQGAMVPVTIKVFERKPQSLRLSVGYGTEDLLRLRLSQVNRNLFGWGETLTFEGKLSSIYRGLQGRLEVPYIFNRRSKLLVTGGQEQKEEEAYTNRRLFFSPLLEYRLGRYWSWYLGYNVENNQLVTLLSVVPDPDFERQLHFISSVPVGIRYDSRDNPLDPRRGTYFRLESETALKLLGSEVNFVRAVGELRHVLPLGKEWFLAGRAEAGFCQVVEPTKRVPLIRRFFPGGPNSVRGFPYQRLGPLDENGRPLGGVATLEGSLELRTPRWKGLGGVLFLDGGNAWESVELPIPTFYYTVGMGLRYQTPLGPLRLDFGKLINPPDNEHIPGYQIYLSVGQAF